MVTGIETAGIVLGVLPLVIKALEHYNEGLKPLKDFVRYKSLIQELADDLDTQWTRLKSTCEKLLTGLTIYDEDLPHLLDDPTSSVWKKEYLVYQLKNRFQGSYPAFLRILGKLAGILQNLTDEIGLDGQGRPQWADRRAHKRCWSRFTACLRRKEHEDLISRMARENDFLQHLTADSLHLESPRSHRRNQKKSFKQVRDHAARLHSALRSGLSCDCGAAHCAELRLERRDWDQPPCFQVTFPLTSTPSHNSPPTWHETEIKANHTTAQPSEIHCDTAISTMDISENVSSLSTPLQHLKITKKSVAWAMVPAVKAANLSFPDMKGVQGQPSSRPEARDIKDLCSVLRCTETQTTNSILGRLTDDQSHYEVVSISHHGNVDIHALTLHDLLMNHNQGHSMTGAILPPVDISVSRGDPRLTRKARLQLAVTLASASLQLYATPWLIATGAAK